LTGDAGPGIVGAVGRRLAAGALMLAAGGVLAGCEGDVRAQLVVVVHTDMRVPGDLDRVVLRVRDPEGADGGVVREETIDLGTGDEQVMLPQSFGVAPRGGDVRRRVRVEVDAVSAGRVLFGTWALTSFVRGARSRLDLWLSRRCLVEATGCEVDEACGRAGCAPGEIPASTLPAFDPRDPLETDAGGPAPTCRILPQMGCPAGQTCYYVDGTGTVCAAPGNGAPGTPCEIGPDCLPGYECLFISGASGRCRSLCLTDADCGAAGPCIAVFDRFTMAPIPDIGDCLDACDPLASACPVPTDTCDVIAVTTREGRSATATYCRTPGSGADGSGCLDGAACAAGHTCDSSACRRLCRVGGTDCAAGRACVASRGLPGVGICRPASVDAGMSDAGPLDAGGSDAGSPDAALLDAPPVDADPVDADDPDAGAPDADTMDGA
jgi:hypothetical protein